MITNAFFAKNHLKEILEGIRMITSKIGPQRIKRKERLNVADLILIIRNVKYYFKDKF